MILQRYLVEGLTPLGWTWHAVATYRDACVFTSRCRAQSAVDALVKHSNWTPETLRVEPFTAPDSGVEARA